jgi:hypothetical protein
MTPNTRLLTITAQATEPSPLRGVYSLPGPQDWLSESSGALHSAPEWLVARLSLKAQKEGRAGANMFRLHARIFTSKSNVLGLRINGARSQSRASSDGRSLPGRTAVHDQLFLWDCPRSIGRLYPPNILVCGPLIYHLGGRIPLGSKHYLYAPLTSEGLSFHWSTYPPAANSLA